MKKGTILRVIILGVSIALAVLAYELNTKHDINNGILETNSTYITNKTIVLDAGHGLPDEGAEGVYGTTEQYINLQIVFKIQKLLEQSGANVILTRSDENGIYTPGSKSIYDKKVSDIKNRVEIVNNSGADMLISIHLNKYPQDSVYRGWQTFYQKSNPTSMRIAEIMQSSLNSNIAYNNTRTCKSISDIYLMDNSKLPSVIIECGFLSNYEETSLLKTEDYQNKIAWGIYVGINRYFEERENN